MVEIRIDTRRDSHEEIRNTIRYLQTLIGESASEPGPSSDETPAAPAGAFDMFGSDDDAPSDYTPDSSSEKDDDDDDAVIEIVEY